MTTMLAGLAAIRTLALTAHWPFFAVLSLSVKSTAPVNGSAEMQTM